MADETTIKTPVQRRQIADYLGTMPAGSATQTYALMNSGFTAIDESTGVTTKEKQYVGDKAKTTNISGYNGAFAFTADHIADQTAVAALAAVAHDQKTGSDALFDYVRVDLYATPTTEGKYPARYFLVSAEVTDYKPDDTDMQLSGNLHQIGDMVPGTFDITTKTFTKTA
jgi:hypothetical protein